MNGYIYALAASPPGKESLNRNRRGFEGRSVRFDEESNRLLPAAKRATIPLISSPWYRHYKGADKSLARPGRKQATATEDFEFPISHLLS